MWPLGFTVSGTVVFGYADCPPGENVCGGVIADQYVSHPSSESQPVRSVTPGVSSRCQLQALLRLELCRLFPSEQRDSLDVDQMAEEVR